MSNMLVSIIVPTRNSGHHLAACLESIRNQTYQPVELIVVDNHSSDDTATIATLFATQLLVAVPERSAQLNRGAEASAG